MANITKRMNKKLAGWLEPGETVEIALLLEPKGQYGVGMLATALAPRTSQRSMAKRDAADRATAPGIAASVPVGSQVMAVSQTRVRFARSNGLTVSEPELVLPREAVRVGRIEGKGLGKRVTLVFHDGSSVVFDAQRGQPFGELEQGLGTAPAPPA